MLVIDRKVGQEMLIGDHSLITLISVTDDGAKFGFDTRDQVKRVDRPEHVMEAARIKARVSRSLIGRSAMMAHPPVFISTRQLDDGSFDVRASLRREMVAVTGYDVRVVDDRTTLGPANHEFVVVRCSDKAEARAIRKLISTRVLEWRLYEEIEGEDASPYLLFVRATNQKKAGEGDVRYIDFGSANVV
jgi:sRNA-binding carbon storage regulator CsrA